MPAVQLPFRSRRPLTALGWARATAVGGTVTALAAGAHAWAGGALPHPLILAALLALVALASTALARLTLRLPALVGVLGAGQLALHEAFAAFSGSQAASPGAAEALARGRHQHAGDAAAALGSLHPAPDVLADHSHASPAMLGLHAAATLACAVVIRRAERAVEALAAWLRPLVRLPRPAAVVPTARLRPVPPRPARRMLPWRQLAPPPLRGPPPAPAFA
ncbi:hypothetical protein [Sinomonas mesophila]|uniref:hypothetical protein n=1 Tax=Sinomonas mesophila TaxID=1531955 RepID=UPI0009867153|nr:hypothetical protein [Sinomonas mesophila]